MREKLKGNPKFCASMASELVEQYWGSRSKDGQLPFFINSISILSTAHSLPKEDQTSKEFTILPISSGLEPARSILIAFSSSSSSFSILSTFQILICSISQDPTSCENLESSLEFIESYMAEHGPFDGLLGFSQVIKGWFS